MKILFHWSLLKWKTFYSLFVRKKIFLSWLSTLRNGDIKITKEVFGGVDESFNWFFKMSLRAKIWQLKFDCNDIVEKEKLCHQENRMYVCLMFPHRFIQIQIFLDYKSLSASNETLLMLPSFFLSLTMWNFRIKRDT